LLDSDKPTSTFLALLPGVVEGCEGHEQEERDDNRKNRKTAATETVRTRTGTVITTPFDIARETEIAIND
jgi:hypothetical protein